MRNFIPERMVRQTGTMMRMNIDDGDIFIGEFANGALGSIQTSFVTVGNYPGIEARLYGSKGALICRLVEEEGICERLWAATPDQVEFRELPIPDRFYPPGGNREESWRSLFYANLVSSFITEILSRRLRQRRQLRRRRVGAGDDQRGRAIVPGATMGQPAAAVTPGAALDRFFEDYYRRRPVTATFTGVHAHDHALPDWSPAGLGEAADEMRAQRALLRAAGLVPDDQVRRFPDEVDLALADGFLEIQIAEHEGPHFYRGNPALWTGEAIFAIVSLVTRDFAPLADRLAAATTRMAAVPRFLADARRHAGGSRRRPGRHKARRECEAAEILFGTEPAGVVCGLWRVRDDGHGGNSRSAHWRATAFRSFAQWIDASLPAANHLASAGEPLLDLLLRRGHYCDTPVGALRAEALESLAEARAALDAQAKPFGGWEDAQRQLAASHPTRERYFDRFAEVWTAARAAALAHDLVSWPDAPIRYVPIPEHTRDAAPLLYYLFYRSPAAFDRLPIHDYVVTPPEVSIASDSTITLNHVIHHGGIGHHVQNWHAYRSASRIGQVAAIDAASRIAMFSGGSLAEGWACYVCDLMEEIGFLSPLERVSQQHTRVRLLARAVVDLVAPFGDDGPARGRDVLPRAGADARGGGGRRGGEDVDVSGRRGDVLARHARHSRSAALVCGARGSGVLAAEFPRSPSQLWRHSGCD